MRHLKYKRQSHVQNDFCMNHDFAGETLEE